MEAMSQVKDISVTDAAAKLASEDVQLVDVRRQDEWDGSRLDNAVHIELELLPTKAEELDKDKPVLFYCYTGVRSAMAAEAFAASGFDAYNVTGGIKAWNAAGQPLDPPGAEIVH
jgi:rhodanese-related sulfurtransferase